jgi:hypothetical protein
MMDATGLSQEALQEVINSARVEAIARNAERRDDGGPAFPAEELHDSMARPGGGFLHVHGSQGMTLRDYFAAKAMQGELAAQSAETGEWMESALPALATRSYAIADAMLKARQA